MDGLTWGDRAKMIEQRRAEETGWKSTQVAKEAFARIDRALDIVPGANRRMLSDEEARARDIARTMLYDRIEALPPEERQSAILAESTDVIKTAIRERASTQAERARTMLQRYKESVGDPAEMNERERQQYNTEIARYENIIREAEQKSAQ
jgi:hypothetical protein